MSYSSPTAFSDYSERATRAEHVSRSDSELVSCCAARGEDALMAFSELYDRQHRFAAALAYRLQANPKHADELVEAAFRTLWERAPRYDPTHLTVQAWLLGLVQYHARATWSPLPTYPDIAVSAVGASASINAGS